MANLKDTIENYYALPTFVKDLPEIKKLDIIVPHLYFLQDQGEAAKEMLQRITKETIRTYSIRSGEYWNDPRLLEVFLIQATIRNKPKEMMKELYRRGQFRCLAEFYIVWAMIQEKEKNTAHVMEIYNLGCADAKPPELFTHGLWKIGKALLGRQLAITYGFLSGEPISRFKIRKVKQSRRSAEPALMERSVLRQTPSPQKGSTRVASPPSPVSTSNYRRMLRHVRIMLTQDSICSKPSEQTPSSGSDRPGSSGSQFLSPRKQFSAETRKSPSSDSSMEKSFVSSSEPKSETSETESKSSTPSVIRSDTTTTTSPTGTSSFSDREPTPKRMRNIDVACRSRIRSQRFPAKPPKKARTYSFNASLRKQKDQ